MEGLPWIPRRPFLDPRFFAVFSGSPSTLGCSPDPRLFVGPCPPFLDSRPEKTPSGDPRSRSALPSFPCRATGCSMAALEEGCSSMSSEDELSSDQNDRAFSAMGGAACSSAGPRKRKRDQRPTKTSRTQSAQGEWETIVENVSEQEAFQALERERILVFQQGSAQWGPATWKPMDGYNNKGVRRRLYRCPFRGAANAQCQAQLRLTEDSHHNWTVERSHKAHSDHNISHKARGLPKSLRLAATSPRKQGMSTGQVTTALRNEVGALSVEERKQLAGLRKREQHKDRTKFVPAELQGTFGGVRLWAEQHTRPALIARQQFGIHAPYVLGTPQIDPESAVINIAISTENLLLNAYRQSVHGMPTIVHVDCTHRLVLDGHACMLFGTVDAAQQWHSVVSSLPIACMVRMLLVHCMAPTCTSYLMPPRLLDWVRRVRPRRRRSSHTCLRVYQARSRRDRNPAHSGSGTHLGGLGAGAGWRVPVVRWVAAGCFAGWAGVRWVVCVCCVCSGCGRCG